MLPTLKPKGRSTATFLFSGLLLLNSVQVLANQPLLRPLLLGCTATLLLHTGCTLIPEKPSIADSQTFMDVEPVTEKVAEPIVLDGFLISVPQSGSFYDAEQIDAAGAWQVVAKGGLNCRSSPGVPAENPSANVRYGAMPENNTFLYAHPSMGSVSEMQRVWLHGSYWVKVSPNILTHSVSGAITSESCYVNAHSNYIKPINTQVLENSHANIPGKCPARGIELRYEAPDYHVHLCRIGTQETLLLTDGKTGRMKYYAENRPVFSYEYEKEQNFKTLIEDEPFTLRVSEKNEKTPVGIIEIEFHENPDAKPISLPILKQYKSQMITP